VPSDYPFRVLNAHAILSGHEFHNHSALIGRLHLFEHINQTKRFNLTFKFIKLQMVNRCEPITNGNELEQLKNTADQFKQSVIVSQQNTRRSVNTDA
jgi:hypothetical protein